jgi:hypothetical protein
MNVENVLKDLDVEGSIIQFKAAWGKQQGYLKVYPGLDSMGRMPYVEELSEEDKRTSPWFVDAMTAVTIRDGFTLDMSIPRDRELLARVLNGCEDVAESMEDAQMKPTAVYYVHCESKELQVRVRNARHEFEANKIIFEDASESEKVELCRLLGSRVDDLTPTAVLDYLVSISKTTPKLLVDSFNAKDKKIKAFLYKALDKGAIRIRENGLYEYNGLTLGTSEDSALGWLQDTDNKLLVVQIKNEVFPQYVRPTIEAGFFDMQQEGPASPAQGDESSPGDFGGIGDETGGAAAVLTPAQKGAATKAAKAAK